MKLSHFFPPTAVDYLLQGIDLALKDGRLHVVEYPQSGEKLVAPASGKGPTDVQWFEARLQALPFQVDGEDAVLWVAHNISDSGAMPIASWVLMVSLSIRIKKSSISYSFIFLLND